MGGREPGDEDCCPPDAPPFPQPLLDALAADPLTPVFEHGDRVLVRGELLELIGRCTAGLRRAGVRGGHGVALATAVTPEGFAARIAVQALGCRAVGVDPGVPAVQLAEVLRDVDAVLTDAPSPELVAAAGPAQVLSLDAEFLREHERPAALGRPEDPAAVVFTSGGTGHPRGAVFDFRALTAHWSWQPTAWGAQAHELAAGYRRFLLFGTLSSAQLLEHLALCLLSGGTAVIPTWPLEFPQVLTRLRITGCVLSVPRLHRVLDALRESAHDLSALRMLLVAGSPLSPQRLAEAHERIGPAVHHCYGQTETGMLALLSAADVAGWPRAAGSVGRPLDGVRLDVRDAAGNPVRAGAEGEVWARVPHALSGYWRDAAETAEVLRDGWVRTRDLGRFDELGFLHLTGRTREVVIVHGTLHHAGPIERALAAHPGVEQACVAGAPDEASGEAIHAFVVPAAGCSPEADELRELVAAELGAGAVPATITAVPEIPLSAAGKPDKRALLARLATG